MLALNRVGETGGGGVGGCSRPDAQWAASYASRTVCAKRTTAGNLPRQPSYPPRANESDRDVLPRDVARASVGLVQQGLVKLGATTTTSHLVVPKPLFYSAVDDVCVARPLDLSSDEESDGHARIMLALPPVEH